MEGLRDTVGDGTEARALFPIHVAVAAGIQGRRLDGCDVPYLAPAHNPIADARLTDCRSVCGQQQSLETAIAKRLRNQPAPVMTVPDRPPRTGSTGRRRQT